MPADNEIEVTIEMIEAGTICFWEGDRQVENIEDILARVYRAMWVAKGLEAIIDDDAIC